jgi:phosphate-selective porin
MLKKDYFWGSRRRRNLRRRSTCWAAIAVCAISAGSPAAWAAKRTNAVPISVSVKAITTIKTSSQPTTFTITKDDIKAGYILIQNAGSYTVNNNDRAGFNLIFRTGSYAAQNISSVTVASGLNQAILLADAGLTNASQPYATFVTPITIAVKIVFQNKKDEHGNDKLTPGTYPWPILSVGVQAI